MELSGTASGVCLSANSTITESEPRAPAPGLGGATTSTGSPAGTPVVDNTTFPATGKPATLTTTQGNVRARRPGCGAPQRRPTWAKTVALRAAETKESSAGHPCFQQSGSQRGSKTVLVGGARSAPAGNWYPPPTRDAWGLDSGSTSHLAGNRAAVRRGMSNRNGSAGGSGRRPSWPADQSGSAGLEPVQRDAASLEVRAESPRDPGPASGAKARRAAWGGALVRCCCWVLPAAASVPDRGPPGTFAAATLSLLSAPAPSASAGSVETLLLRSGSPR
mmetsp:Transcript_6319/g.26234  ORF Transcript_6319/g.26234 Transcript_6319/m.26234 type:complete len:277 (-) Transcript_6319:887-1717(-)